MLPGAGLGDQALLAHAFCEQCLPERVVEFVGSPVDEIFPLQVDPAPEFPRCVRAERERCLAAGIFRLQCCKFADKSAVFFCLLICGLQFDECVHECL